MKQQVLESWLERAERARQEAADLEASLTRARYEQEIAQRLLARSTDQAARERWQTQVDVMSMIIASDEEHLAEQQEDLVLCRAMIAEIEADLHSDAG